MAAFEAFKPDFVVHLAAQAGVRYSLEHPDTYVQSNVVGFLNILEASRNFPIKHLVFASSSSVYGLNSKLPYSVHDSASHPVSLYAATKISDEMMAHSYAHLFNIPCTGIRFFTVYGPWGRPDMSPFLFSDSISKGKPLKVYNYGKMRRDFTYIDDIVEGVIRIMNNPPKRDDAWDSSVADCSTSSAPYAIYNIGNSHPFELIDFIRAFEKAFGRDAEIKYLPMQPGDVLETFSDMSDMEQDFGFVPKVDINEGVRRYVKWFREYYSV
jgi:UDP-glucuronate 4-epimerase